MATEIMNSTKCISGICIYQPASNGRVSSSYDNVSVAAENVIGIGTARTCTTQTISELNLRFILSHNYFYVCHYCQFCLDQLLLCDAW